MATILKFVKKHDGTFEPQVTKLMGEAFDAACAASMRGGPVDQEAVAARIIDAARAGERDLTTLTQAGIGFSRS